ncbi:MAG: tRNA lysidine(34) synthetase TilS [Clostridiales bacterium]|nr:tRNA lysidine(34) synthetase TilS [Clostridiales bacterium]
MLSIEKVTDAIEEHNLLNKGDKVVVAVSGGPDSVCLLHLLCALKDRYEMKLYVAHLNHNFRGIEAQKDAQYVANLCEELNVICFVKSVNVTSYAKQNHMSDEEAGRIKRYEFFNEVKEKVGANKIAVGHNLNDQAETLLMRLLRGAGLQGLSSIWHKRGDVIRPLLDVEREDIEEYCSVNNLTPRIDATNLKPVYHRNKIRLELMPYLKENYNPNLTESLARTAKIFKEDSDYLDLQANENFELISTIDNDDKVTIPIAFLDTLHGAMKTRVFRLAAERLVGRREVFTYMQIQNILALVDNNSTGKKLQLSMAITATISYDKLIFTTTTNDADAEYLYRLEIGGFVKVDVLNTTFKAKLVNENAIKDVGASKSKKFFDFDRIINGLCIRNRKQGDIFKPLGMKGTKKLKNFFIDKKIDREERDKIALVCDGERIMWVVGHRISDYYKITKNTTRFLLIECYENEL